MPAFCQILGNGRLSLTEGSHSRGGNRRAEESHSGVTRCLTSDHLREPGRVSHPAVEVRTDRWLGGGSSLPITQSLYLDPKATLGKGD